MTTPQYYHFSRDGVYTGSTDVDLDARDPEVVMPPPYGATLIEPPAVGTKQAAKFDGSVWSVVIDRRGESYWTSDGQQHTIENVDEAPPEGALSAPPPLTTDQLKADFVGLGQKYLDTLAQSWGYDDIFTAVTYADETAVPKFEAEGKALRKYRSEFWAAAYLITPTASDTEASLLSQLPPAPTRPA